MRRLLCLAISGALLGGCSGSETPPPATLLDAGAGGPDATVALPRFQVRSVEVVDGLGSDALLGDPLELMITPAGVPAVAYGAVPVGSTRREIRYAERRAEDDWTVETAVIPGAAAPAQGDLLALGSATFDGAVHLVYLGGDDDENVLTPFPTDLVMASRGGNGQWTERVLADTSGDAPGNCPDSQDYCNFGNVVGSHAALAAGPSGAWAAVYRDTHASFADDDLRRSDVEVVVNSTPRLVDPERGGGPWARIAFLPDGRVAVAYVIETAAAGRDERGIWVAIENGGSFQPVQVTREVTIHRLGFAVSSEGQAWLTWFDAANGDLEAASSSAPFDTWSVETVDARGSVGLHPDLALSATGTPYIVYGYCGVASDRSCPGNPGADAEVRLARRQGGAWTTETVDNGEGRGGVGFYNRLHALPSGGWAIAYQDLRNNDVVVVIAEEMP